MKVLRVIAVIALVLVIAALMLGAGCSSQGPVGPTGATGPQGIQGPKGDKGDPGSSAVIDIIVNESLGNGEYLVAPVLSEGMPIIKKGYRVQIYGAGFVVGEMVTFSIADYNHSFNIGTTTVINNAGVFLCDIVANWPNYTWQDSGHAYGVIKAVGDKGSTAVSFVNIGQE